VTTPGAVCSCLSARMPDVDWLIGGSVRLPDGPIWFNFEALKVAKFRSTLNFSIPVRTLPPDSKRRDHIAMWVGEPSRGRTRVVVPGSTAAAR
jgi:hypothetical protein